MILALAGLALARPAAMGAVDSETYPIRCHWQRVADEERCATVLLWAETAWAAQVDRIGFAAPLPDGDEGGSEALDIYLTVDETSGAGEAWVDCVGGDGSCADADPADGRAAAPAYVVIDARTDDADLPEYVVHEFNHVTQYATDWAEPFLCAWEGTAVAAQIWTLGEPSSPSEIADYQATPWLSAVLQDGYLLDEQYGLWSWYEYGAVTWVLWLDHAWGDGAGSVGPALWDAMTQEGAGTEPDVLDAWDTLSGDWRADLLAFTAMRARMGGEHAPDWIAWAEAPAWREHEGIDAPGTYAAASPVFPLGVAFFDLEVPEGARWEIGVSVGDEAEWVVVAVAGDTETSGETLPWEQAGAVTIAAVNLGPALLDADDALAASDVSLTITDLDEPAGDGDDPEGEPPIEETSGGCGCATGGAAPAWIGLAGLLAVRRARRRPTG